MGRALTRTWLPIDEWARFHGFDPLHFNAINTAEGHPLSNCDRTWTQHHWQRSQTAREDVAEAILDAENQIADLLKTNLVPDWNEERIEVIRHWQPGVIQLTPFMANDYLMQVKFPRRHWLMGGERATEILGDAAAVTWPGGDELFTNNKLATITVAGVDADLNPNEVRLFYEPDADLSIGTADPAWEIRPLNTVDVTGTTLTVTVKRELLTLPSDQEEAPVDFEGVNGDLNASFVAAVDVVRVYNDPQNQVQLEWVPAADSEGCGSCVACLLRSQTGCVVGVNREAGILSFGPATWDATDEVFNSRTLAVCRQPDRVLLRSYSGLEAGTSRGETYNPRMAMDRRLAQYVAILSAANLWGEACGCEAAARVQNWQEEMDANLEDKSYQVGFNELRNPLGMTKGAMWVWRRLKREQQPNFAVGAISAR